MKTASFILSFFTLLSTFLMTPIGFADPGTIENEEIGHIVAVKRTFTLDYDACVQKLEDKYLFDMRSLMQHEGYMCLVTLDNVPTFEHEIKFDCPMTTLDGGNIAIMAFPDGYGIEARVPFEQKRLALRMIRDAIRRQPTATCIMSVIKGQE